MNTASRDNEHASSTTAHPGALALISMPFAFTQDNLLDTGQFIKAADERGYRLNLDDLQSFHNNRLILPLYRVSDTAVRGRRIDIAPNGNLNSRYQAQVAASEGRLWDSSDEGYSAAWPYKRPAEEDAERWWNGFLYSDWQLLDLHNVTREYEFISHGFDRAPAVMAALRRRQRALALAALAPKYMPGILGKLSIPPSLDQRDLERFRFEADVLA